MASEGQRRRAREIVGRMLGFAAVLLALVPLAAALRGPVARRGRQVREGSRKMMLLALLTLPMGFAWAAARAAVSAF